MRKFRLGEEPADDLAGTTVEERVEMVWQLTLDAWAAAGREIPTYRRSEMPVRVFAERRTQGREVKPAVLNLVSLAGRSPQPFVRRLQIRGRVHV